MQNLTIQPIQQLLAGDDKKNRSHRGADDEQRDAALADAKMVEQDHRKTLQHVALEHMRPQPMEHRISNPNPRQNQKDQQHQANAAGVFQNTINRVMKSPMVSTRKTQARRKQSTVREILRFVTRTNKSSRSGKTMPNP